MGTYSYLPFGMQKVTMISTRHLASLPDIDGLKRLCQSLATLDALLMPDWEYRYYSFNAKWSAGQVMASMRDGSGDDYYIVFDEAVGAVVKGYAHESQMAGFCVQNETPYPGVLDQLPAAFRAILKDPAFSIEECTFCLWRANLDTKWSVGDISFPAGDDPDGSRELLSILDGKPATYRKWAGESYERDVPLKLVRYVYSHRPLNSALLSDFEIEPSYEELLADLLEIGYPHEA